MDENEYEQESYLALFGGKLRALTALSKNSEYEVTGDTAREDRGGNTGSVECMIRRNQVRNISLATSQP